LILALPLGLAMGAEEDLAAKIAQHQDGSRKLSEQQDELAADVQQLIIEQTHPKVIELLEGVEDAMDEASGMLLEFDTGGTTIAAETDVIEKIFEAAKERQRQQGQQQGEGQGAMLDMMERMMGKEPGGEQPGDKPGGKPGDKGGEGMTGDSDTANSQNGGAAGGKTEERRIPKSSGTAGQALPREFQEALDAYNRAAGKLVK
jgi:hypothetical protein